MKRFWCILPLLAFPLLAQEPKSPAPSPDERKLFVLKYADPRQVAGLLGELGANVAPNVEMHALAVRARPEFMPAIEEAIKRLDVPAPAPQNIEVTAYFLLAGDNAQAGSVPPKELEAVVTQLKNGFSFKNYRVLDVLTVRQRSGYGSDASSTPGPPEAGLPTMVTQFHIGSATVGSDGATVRIDKMKAGIRLPVATEAATQAAKQFSYVDQGMNADLDIKEGQKVVVGRQSLSRDQALFLVLTAHIVN
jgi:hypothetical protein